MEKRLLVLSDIHGNISALEAVLADCADEVFNGIVLLGDIIDYGMRPNEAVETVRGLEAGPWRGKVLANVWGNHERLLNTRDFERLSSDRGRAMAKVTAQLLTERSKEYVSGNMLESGMEEFEVDGLSCLAVHGSLKDPYWKAIDAQDVNGDYSCYDIVFSGHSHRPHCFTRYYACDDSAMRNERAVIFINPGSVGQPRNHNPRAQYAIVSLPSRRIELRAIDYDIEFEQSLYTDEVDPFYRDRLALGV